MSKIKPPLILSYTRWDEAPWIARFRAALPDRRVLSLAETRDALPERFYLSCWRPPPDLFQTIPKPLLILCPGAGIDNILAANPPADVPITRIVDPDLTGRMVEYVTLHALLHLRQMTGYALSQRAHHWRPRRQPAAHEVTIGLLGAGELGLASASALKAVGFQVIGWRRSPQAEAPIQTYAGAEGLSAFLGATDILVNLLPSTPATRGLIDGALLARLRRPGPLGAPAFINAGRGDAVHDGELVEALRSGVLGAASLDVFTVEPLPADSPYWDLPNVVVTPHVAADSMPDAVSAAIVAEIAAFEAGRPLIHPVDRSKGY